MATGTPAKSTAESTTGSAARRETLGAVNTFLATKDPVLFVFRAIGDRCRGTVAGAELVDSDFKGEARRNAAGMQKKHLQVYLTSPEGDKLVLNVQSQNQKEALRAALEKANVTGLAKGDYLAMEYVNDDEALRDGLNPARVYDAVIEPAA